ncbi:MAG: outer membrane protein assembly factor BamE [Pacificimonas sp.]
MTGTDIEASMTNDKTNIRRTGMKSVALLVAVGLLAGGCTRLRDQQGYGQEEEILTSVAVGVDNRQSVEKTLGRPTFVSQWDPNSWYYVARNIEALAFLRPEPTAQDIMRIRFDATGNVAEVTRDQTLDQIASFDPSGDKTPVYGRDGTLFEEIFGNIGRVSSLPGGGAGGPPRQ